MGKFLDRTGFRYGKLVCVRDTGKRTNVGRELIWECLCDCGNIREVRGGDLTSGSVTSCGCTKNPASQLNLTGYKFGRLTVVKLSEHRVHKGHRYWECICECGGTACTTTGALKSGHTRSCGCIQKEESAKALAITKDKPLRDTAIMTMFHRYKLGATNRNLDFNLTLTELTLLAESNCFYCNESRSSEYRSSAKNKVGQVHNLMGIDRTDSSKGYFYENCRPCCKDCNFAKSNKSESDYYEWVRKVYLCLEAKGVFKDG